MGLLPPLSEVSDRLEVKPTKQQTFALSTLPSSPYGLWKFPRKSAEKRKLIERVERQERFFRVGGNIYRTRIVEHSTAHQPRSA